MNAQQIQKLVELGNEWQKGDKHRIYFNFRKFIGNDENWQVNWLNSNKADWVKIWFDFSDQKFYMRDEYNMVSRNQFEYVVTNIKQQAGIA